MADVSEQEQKELTAKAGEEFFLHGHRACAGCGPATVMKLALATLGRDTVIVNSTGCMEVVSTQYPESSWKLPYVHSLFENVPSVASGVTRAFKALGKKGTVVGIGGDGATYDIGFGALSGAMERNEDMIYLCLPANEELVLGDGKIVKIGEFAEQFLSTNFNAFASADGSLQLGGSIMSAAAAGTVLSWDGSKFAPKNILRVQKKRAPSRIIEFETASGCSIRLTGEHNVLVDSTDGLAWKEAKLISKGDRVISPRKIDLFESEPPFLLDLLLLDEKLCQKLMANIPASLKQELVAKLKAKYGSLANASLALGLASWQFDHKKWPVSLSNLKLAVNAVCPELWQYVCENIRTFTVQGGEAVSLKQPRLSSELCYALGLLCAEGYVPSKNYRTVFTNTDQRLISELIKIISEELPGRKASIGLQNGAKHIVFSHPILSVLCRATGIKTDPVILTKLPLNHAKQFISGFFDGDGCASIFKHKNGTLETRILLTTTNAAVSKRLKAVLQRFGIATASLSKGRYDAIAYHSKDVSEFARMLSPRADAKKAKLAEVLAISEERSHSRTKYFDAAPLAAIGLLGTILKENKISPNSIDLNLPAIIRGTRGASKTKLLQLCEKLSRRLPQAEVNRLKLLCSGNYFIDKVSRVQEIDSPSEFVYDITVEDTHNFIPANSFVIQNCYDNECYANTGVQRSGATPLGAATTTSPSEVLGKSEWKKNLPFICASHGVPYVATASVAFVPDLKKKLLKAKGKSGFRFVHVHAPCPLGWRFDSALTIEMARMAVKCGMWNLFEIEDGSFKQNMRFPQLSPVADYLKAQGRFKATTAEQVAKIQEHVQKTQDDLKKLEESGISFQYFL